MYLVIGVHSSIAIYSEPLPTDCLPNWYGVGGVPLPLVVPPVTTTYLHSFHIYGSFPL